MAVEINVDVGQIQRLIVAHQTALMSFCNEWREAFPDQIERGVAFLNELEGKFELPSGSFTRVTRVLRGETDET